MSTLASSAGSIALTVLAKYCVVKSSSSKIMALGLELEYVLEDDEDDAAAGVLWPKRKDDGWMRSVWTIKAGGVFGHGGEMRLS